MRIQYNIGISLGRFEDIKTQFFVQTTYKNTLAKHNGIRTGPEDLRCNLKGRFFSFGWGKKPLM